MSRRLVPVDRDIRLLRTIQTRDVMIANVVHDILLEVLGIDLHIFSTRKIVSLPRLRKPVTTIKTFHTFSRWSSKNEFCPLGRYKIERGTKLPTATYSPQGSSIFLHWWRFPWNNIRSWCIHVLYVGVRNTNCCELVPYSRLGSICVAGEAPMRC